jgi:hypothetical protein
MQFRGRYSWHPFFISSSMKVPIGKILIRFNTAQITDTKFMQYGSLKLLLAKPENPNDFSIEIGEVYAVNDKQQFFKAGDKAMVNCLVYSIGQYDRVATPKRLVTTLEDGSQVYWAYDGTDGNNDSDLYGRFGRDGIEMFPGYLLVANPPKPAYAKSGLLFVHSKVDRARPYWTMILSVNPDDAKELDVAIKQKILVEGDITFTVKAPDQEYSIVKKRYLLLKENPQATVRQLQS